MQVRKYNQELDYPTIAQWYLDWDLPITPANWLGTEGVVVEDDNKKICMGFVWKMGDSVMFFLEGITSNPIASKNEKLEALPLLIENLTNRAKELGGEIVISSTPRETLKKVFLNCGYGEPPEKYNHVARLI